MFVTEQKIEKAILVGVDRGISDWEIDESLAELGRLVSTAGADVVSAVSQRMKSPNPRTFIGKGKVEEVLELARALEADIVVFDDELSPSQQSNLERELGKAKSDIKVIDRTALILDIFALHATTREGRLQVRLAQNQYLLPRLRGMWAHLAAGRMGGGVGSRFGEGESQLEVDRRMVRNRISSIRQELKKLQADRATQRAARLDSGIFKIAIAGYTNAGKSTLLNYLTDADVLAYDQLFATLDSTTRRLSLPDGGDATLTDTVGFIQKLPTTLVEAFRSTLDEITQADLVLHIVDASSEQRVEQMRAVQEVLEQIDAHQIPQIIVFNKIDLLDEVVCAALARANPGSQLVSAVTGEGMEGLLEHIQTAANASSKLMEVLLPFDRGQLVNLAHQRTTVVSQRYLETGTWMQIRVPLLLVAQFDPYLVSDSLAPDTERDLEPDTELDLELDESDC
ncbi:MAG: GTPase HflX [Coriobacteriia bacterium]|nr:GTPase HflX [Coriobacteriia bacterium]